jgi:diketogulonate reductase-like aldo/keto reductase
MNLPPLGFGCSPFRSEGRRVDLEEAVRVAVSTGYRLFDLAELYGNERAVGRALRSPKRSELFLVGKVWRTNFRPEALWKACEDSLARLGFEAFDLYLLHAPEAWRHAGPLGDPEETGWEDFERRAVPRDAQGAPVLDDVPLRETWDAMGELARRGLTGAIGVSNFDPGQIEALGPPLPATNQIASSPFEPNAATVAACRAKGIALMAHSPLSAPGLLSAPPLVELAGRLGRTPAQIVLRWNFQRGLTPLPSSADPSHIAENLGALEFSLSPEDMAAVDSLAIHSAR